jgi:hypothetical protein
MAWNPLALSGHSNYSDRLIFCASPTLDKKGQICKANPIPPESIPGSKAFQDPQRFCQALPSHIPKPFQACYWAFSKSFQGVPSLSKQFSEKKIVYFL